MPGATALSVLAASTALFVGSDQIQHLVRFDLGPEQVAEWFRPWARPRP